ncbi:hypothetical protein SAMN02990966_03712 [Rhodospirillales bacterium URHD0017]|nr:hypothetical protein SAMN02990966_03712 [Rhodospirillales bacterium URHD0017]
MIGGMKLRSSAVVLAALFPAAVAAQTMDFACPAPGTTFTYDSGTKVVARGKDGMDCTMEIVGGKPYKLRALLFDNPAPDGADTTAYINALKPERLWPLAVGKKVEADFSSGGKKWHYILSVVRYEKRTGPGDAMIDTFLIEMQEQGPAGERSVSRWWISPADKFAIRYDYSDGSRANRAVVTSVTR